jgi:glycosyltransferase involved in cell wall biosynthesis
MKVCFVAENAYPAIAEKGNGAFGGMETQAWVFAKALEQLKTCEVSFTVSSPEDFDVRTHANIKVLNRRNFIEHVRRDVSKHCTIQHRWPLFRIRRWSHALLWKIPVLLASKPFRAADNEKRHIDAFYRSLSADVILVFGVSSITTAVVKAAKASGKKVVISCASNDDLRIENRRGSDYINVYGDSGHVLGEGLEAADAVFVQTQFQQQLATTNHNLHTDVLPNPVDDQWLIWSMERVRLLSGVLERTPELRKPFILWTGRTDRFHKRPAMAFELANLLPQHQFVMVINETDPNYADELRRTRPSNVLFLPPFPYPQFLAIMSLATAFLSTGTRQYEGFPNVFLQAGMLGVPVVSADCDFGILSDTGIGQSFDDRVQEMAESLNQICTFPEQREQRIRYVREKTLILFGGKAIAAKLWELLRRLEGKQRC